MRKRKLVGKRPPVDPDDAPELTAEWFQSADLKRGERVIRRGRPPLERPKEAVTLRIDADVLDYFRHDGPGWQTRINEVLRKAARKSVKSAGSPRLKAARR